MLEHADPDADDLAAELRRHVAEQLRWWYVPADPDAIADALLPVHATPLGPLVPGLTLRDIPLRDRLRELDFELPLAGGDGLGRLDHRGELDHRGPDVRVRYLAPLLRRHLPADDPLAAYASQLEQPLLGDQALRGYLSGSVDVVLRTPGPDGPRFVVVDYKTNRLDGYDPDSLAEAMLHSHYPLQAMLYSVVLHRYLRWRLPGYDPERHFGGVLYLYLRGMAGADSPVTDGHPDGVFSWPPPVSLVLAMSDLLDGVLDVLDASAEVAG